MTNFSKIVGIYTRGSDDYATVTNGTERVVDPEDAEQAQPALLSTNFPNS